VEFEAISRTACPLCGNERAPRRAVLWDDRYGQPDRYLVRFCEPCRFAFLGPAVSPKDVPQLYAKYYPHHAARTPPKWRQGALWRFARWLDGNVNPMRYISPGDTVLDIGAGNGTLLAQAASVRAECVGLEADRSAAEIVQRSGFECYMGTVEAFASSTDTKFSKVVLNQVIEHVLDPVSTLKACRRLLTPGGAIVVATPLLGSRLGRRSGRRWLNWHVPYHVNWFSRKALDVMADICRLRCEHIRRATPNSWLLAQGRLSLPATRGRVNPRFRIEYPVWQRLLVAPLARLSDMTTPGDAAVAVMVPSGRE